MEDEIQVWHKYISGFGRWKKKYIQLKDQKLIILQKKDGKIKHQFNIKNIKLKEDTQNLKCIKLFTGIKKIHIKCTTEQSKKMWITFINKNQNTKDGDEKFKNVLTDMIKNHEIQTVSFQKQIQNILDDKNHEIIEKKLGFVNDRMAHLSAYLSDLSDICINEKQQKLLKNINIMSKNLKSVIQECCNDMFQQQKNLKIVQEIFQKYYQNYILHEQKDFEKTMNKLLETKYKKSKSKSQLIENSEISEEISNDSENSEFLSFEEKPEEMEKIRQSFYKPKNYEKEQQDSINTENILQQLNEPEKIKLHPLITQLLRQNKVFQQYPVLNHKEQRKILPAFRDMKLKLKIWSMLKQFIGKDLTRITMPIFLNTPQSMLQKIGEVFEYHHCFKLANETNNKSLQCGYILAAFIIVYSNTIGISKKPFNPLLSETYEYYDPITKTTMVLEQVSHHPPICAFYGENQHFILQGHAQVKTTFTMKGIFAIPLGITQLTLKNTQESFIITKPLTSVHNLIIGEMYTWSEGDCYCQNEITGHKALLKLHPKSAGFFSGNNDYTMEGKIFDENGKVNYLLEGKWSSYLNAISIQNEKIIKLVEKIPDVENRIEQYSFSKWMINMNHLRQIDLSQLPPTDCRFRPDLRAYEHGDLELGSQEKQRLEEKQRKKRKQREQQGIIWKPKWFDFEIEKDEVLQCQWNGLYFQCKKNQQWSDQIDDLYLQVIFQNKIFLFFKQNFYFNKLIYEIYSSPWNLICFQYLFFEFFIS